MEEYVTRLEYDEHNRRTDDEHRRINKRLELLEENVVQDVWKEMTPEQKQKYKARMTQMVQKMQ